MNQSGNGPSNMPLRSLAMVLLAAAVVFFGVGWFSVSTDDSSPETVTAAADSSSAKSDDSTSGSGETASERSEGQASRVSEEDADDADTSVVTSVPATTTTTVPSTTLPPPPQPAGEIRVYNNSMVTGLAGWTADSLRSSGWPVAETGNFNSQVVPRSTAYYTNAPGERQLAERVAGVLGITAAPRTSAIADLPAGVVVIVTQDLDG